MDEFFYEYKLIFYKCLKDPGSLLNTGLAG